MTLLLPDVGSASSLPQMRQSTTLLAFPNIICSFLHLGHCILMNLLVVSRIRFLIVHLGSIYLNSIFRARNPPLRMQCIFLQIWHSNRKSVFLLVFRPAILHLVIAGFEYFPWFPMPILPRCLMRFLLPALIGCALPLPFFLPSIILCSVCFLHVGQYLFRVFGSFIASWEEEGFKKVTVGFK